MSNYDRVEEPLLSPIDFAVMPPFGWILAGLWGALWGSFFNVAIYRVGIYESVVKPRSRCGGCGMTIAWYDNVPMLSWLVLRGRCRRCKSKISIRYPLVELVTTLLALAVYWRYVAVPGGDAVVALAHFLTYFAFVGCLIVLTGIDFDHQLLPDVITYPAIPLCLVAGVMLRDVPPLDLLIGPFAGYAIVAVTAEAARFVLKKEAMGYGDAKMLAMFGAMLGWRAAVVTFFISPFFAIAVAVPSLILSRKKVHGTAFPFGPFLAVAAILLVLYPTRAWPPFIRQWFAWSAL